MYLRGFTGASGLVVLALVTVSLAASCSQEAVYPPEDGGTGAGFTTVSSSSSSSVAASSSSSASSSGAGGSASCPALNRCTTAKDCPKLDTVCIATECTDGCCVTSDAPARTACTDSGGKLCSGTGACVTCVADSDCPADENCVKGACLLTHCTDGVKDDGETDVDCGGGQCPPCADGKICTTGTDCVDLVCTSDTCQPASCSDGVKNGMETDVDCGGPTCPKCVNNDTCSVPSDCQSLSCMSGKCAAATCTDDIQDGMETDVDCGGPVCQPCADTKHCVTGTDCVDKVCSGTPAVCQAPTCTDGVQNGKETDIDCGGSCPPCAIGKKCDVPGDCIGGICSGTCQCPQGMLDVPIFQGSGVYCIDAVEVTYGAYGDFYDANPSTAAQPSYCSWNDTWTPTADWPFLPANSEVPVAYVNWCQASAFCSYSGKRLCGQIGGGSVPQASFADFHTDQWFNACTSEGVNCSTTGCYPYGQAYDSTACNGADPSGAPEPSAMLPACEGGSPLLYQMSGNVAEWEDSCAATAGMSDACSIRGGSFADGPAALRCDSGQSTPITQPRSYTGPDVGFRCCL